MDQKNQLWIGTNKGVDRVELTENGIGTIKFYGYSEGFRGIECNSRAVMENESGEIFFGTVEGIFKYDKELDEKPAYIVQVYINNFKVFLEDGFESYGSASKNHFRMPDSLVVPYYDNHISFEYTGIDLGYADMIRYSYKLDGFDREWSPISRSRVATYSYLHPGTYTFKVMAMRGNDMKSSSQDTCTIIVLPAPPPFYQTFWFYGIMIIIVWWVLYYFLYLKPLKLTKQKDLLEKLVAERTKEILRKDAEKSVMLQEIHHRVKNNLQIITSLFNLQSRFTENEESLALFKESQNRVRSMAKIHEKLYEASDFSKIDLKGYMTELVRDIMQSYSLDKQCGFGY